jgi:hypothetical protein
MCEFVSDEAIFTDNVGVGVGENVFEFISNYKNSKNCRVFQTGSVLHINRVRKVVRFHLHTSTAVAHLNILSYIQHSLTIISIV